VNGIDNQAFGYMTAEADKTDVDLWKPPKQIEPEIGPPAMATNIFGQEVAPISQDDIMNLVIDTTMMGSGSIGKIKILGKVFKGGEDKFKAIKTSVSKLTDIIETNKKALKEYGEEMVDLYRGVTDWFEGSMIKNGKFVGGGRWVDEFGFKGPRAHLRARQKEALWVTPSKQNARINWNQRGLKADLIDTPKQPVILKFTIPKRLVDKIGIKKGLQSGDIVFEGGIPESFLTGIEVYAKDLRPTRYVNGRLEYIK
tara:strand:+ start:81 stop:845 length:765 start_codon:yes stop_codon:yes gene_type:complete